MGWAHEELSVGQLCKEAYGSEAVRIGCSTYTGAVGAAENWGDDMQVMRVKPALSKSYELLLHETGIPCFLLDLRSGPGGCNKYLRRALMKRRLERFIGVVYRHRTSESRTTL